jgi:hypothetical protein
MLMKKYTRKQRGGNFKCPSTAGMSAENTMIGCKMAALGAETKNLNDQVGGARKRRRKKRGKKKRKTKRRKSFKKKTRKH